MVNTVLRKSGLWQYLTASAVRKGQGGNVIIHPETGCWLLSRRELIHLNPSRILRYAPPLADSQGMMGVRLGPDGRLWLQLDATHLLLFDGGTFTPAELPFPVTYIFRLREYGNGGLCYRDEASLTIYDGNRVRVLGEAEGCPQEYRVMRVDAHDNIWMLTSSGLCRCDGESFEPVDVPENIAVGWNMIVDEQGDGLWIESLAGLLHFRDGRFDCERMPSGWSDRDHLNPCYVDSNGGVWCIANPNICVRRERDGSFVRLTARDGLLNEHPVVMGEDVEGGLWFSCKYAGVCRYERRHVTLLADDHVSDCLFRDQEGALWWGDSGDIVRYKDDTREVLYRTNHHICDMAQDEQGRLWVATSSGVWRGNDAGGLDPLPGMNQDVWARCVVRAADGAMWAGQGLRMCRYDENGLTEFTMDQVGLISVTGLLALPDGSLLLWTHRQPGVRIYDGREFKPFEPLCGDRFAVTNGIALGLNNDYWMATRTGVVHVDGQTRRVYGEEEGLGRAERITIDSQGRAWIAIWGRGLAVFDGTHVQMLSGEDVLPSDCVTGVVEEAPGVFVIASYGGVCRFIPNQNTRPTVCVESVVADQTYTDPEAVAFIESVPRMTVQFGGTTLKCVPLRYTYKLEGRDADWREAFIDTVVYEGLPPGEYTLKVRSIDRDLMCSAETAMVRITVLADQRELAISELQAEVKERTHEAKGAQEFAANILRSMSDAIIVVNPDGTIRMLNYGALNLLGYGQEELLGAPMSKLLPADKADLMSPAGIADILDEGVLRNQERIYVAKNGTAIPVLFSASSMCDSEGELQGLVTVASDLREHKQIQDRLLVAQKMESLGVLAGGIAHDFNNLLVGVLGNAELVADELGAQPPVSEEVDEIIRAARRAAQLCKQMLAYAGKGTYVLSDIDLSSTVNDLLGLFKASISKKVHVALQLDPTLPLVKGDEAQISQVVMNLITNASEAIGDQVGTIMIKTSAGSYARAALKSDCFVETPPAGDYVCLDVTDDGCGIAEDIRETLFEPFMTTKFTGRGLGLSAVHGILRAHGGTLQLESEVGKGSTFRVYLPVAGENVGKDDASSTEVSRAPRRYAGTVLLADDEHTVRALAQRMLERLGFTVIVTGNGRECLTEFEKYADDIRFVLLDVTMPELDGCEVFERLHALDSRVSVIICSGYTEEDIGRRFDDHARPAAFIQKPFQKSTLIKAIDRVLKKRG